MAISDAKKKSNAKWDRENMVVISCKMRDALANDFKAACAALGTSPNAVFRAAAQQIIDQYRGKDQPQADT